MIREARNTSGGAGPAAGLFEAVITAEDVEPKLRQSIVLRIAKVLGVSRQAWGGGPMWRDDGLSREEIEAVMGDGPVLGVALDAGLVCDAVDEMFETGTLTDGTLQLMLDRFGDTTIRKLTFIIGCLHLLTLHFGCRVTPTEADDSSGAVESPSG